MTNLTTLTFSICAGLLSLALLFAATFVDDASALHAVLNDLGGVLFASVALAVFWDLVARRRFATEMFETAGVGVDVLGAGLTHIGMRYLKDLDWDVLLAGARELDIFVTYGRTWRNTHSDRLTQLARTRKDARIRVFLPDPDNAEDLAVLSKRFAMTAADLATAIKESRTFYSALDNGDGATVEVYQRSGVTSFSCYRVDDHAVVTLYSHLRERTAVPTLVCKKGGSLYDFVVTELDAIRAQSRLLR